MTPPVDRAWWIEAMLKLGVPAAIACFLVWFLATQLLANMSAIAHQLNDHVTSTNIYLRAVCLHTAKTQAERDDCPLLDPREAR
jgi:hypothetical protein